MKLKAQFFHRLKCHDSVLVMVQSSRGSVPRDEGAWMAVFSDGQIGSIGGGHLEFEALAIARESLVGKKDQFTRRWSLGPSLGQCCGGEVILSFEFVSPNQIEAVKKRFENTEVQVAVFGGGHVGQVLVRLLSELPIQIRWIDSREDIFPLSVTNEVQTEHADQVQLSVADLAPQTRVVIMTHSHSEDLELVSACLLRQRKHSDLPYIGLIGSSTKWAKFQKRLRQREFDQVEFSHITSPIGINDIKGKEPEIIAFSTAVQILQTMTRTVYQVG